MIYSSMAEGFGANDLNQRLLRERIVFLGSQVDQNTANRICAE
ncbi:MAG TPA: ATP-dependent Clp protease proteolytic subunit, partial [Acidimicrobiales bacterium]